MCSIICPGHLLHVLVMATVLYTKIHFMLFVFPSITLEGLVGGCKMYNSSCS